MRSVDADATVAPQHRAGWLDRLFAIVEGALALALGVMLALVLGNVILRYGFGTGINVSEELARLLFIWVVFIGAVIAARERAHLNVDLLAHYLPRTGRWLLALASEVIVVACCVLVVWGTALQHDVLATTRSLVMGYPMSLMYGVAYISGAGIGLISLARIVRLLRDGPSSSQIALADAAHDIPKELVA